MRRVHPAVSAGLLALCLAWACDFSWNEDILKRPQSLAAPTFSVASGDFQSPFTLYLSSSAGAGRILYCNAEDPDDLSDWTEYQDGISLSSSQTVKACVYADNDSFSEVVSQVYSFRLPPCQLSPEPGNSRSENLYVYLSNPIAGAQVFYTLDGSDPSDQDNPSRLAYDGDEPPLVLSGSRDSCQIRAVAELEDWSASEEAGGQYLYSPNGLIVNDTLPPDAVLSLNASAASVTYGSQNLTIDASLSDDIGSLTYAWYISYYAADEGLSLISGASGSSISLGASNPVGCPYGSAALTEGIYQVGCVVSDSHGNQLSAHIGFKVNG